VPADVIEDGFDNVREHAQAISHYRCGGATEVVKPPRRNACTLIKRRFLPRPHAAEAVQAEDEGAPRSSSFEDSSYRWRHGEFVQATVFGSLWGQANEASVKVDFIATECSDFRPALSSED
jgi:hypothetical protein